MKLYYSKSTGGFYSQEIHGASIPNDAVEISQAQHEALLSGQADGKRIGPDAVGIPILSMPSPSMDALKASKRLEIESAYAMAIAPVTAGYTLEERDSWAKQETEARAWHADHAVSTPMLSAIATARGVPLPDLATLVIQKADLFTVLAGAAIGRRRNRLGALDAAQTSAEVVAVVW